MNKVVEHRAEAVRPPQPTPALTAARAAHADHRLLRELLERRSVARGLIVLAVLALGFSIAHAGLDRAFVPGWWQQW
jgi:hypothetical protein